METIKVADKPTRVRFILSDDPYDYVDVTMSDTQRIGASLDVMGGGAYGLAVHPASGNRVYIQNALQSGTARLASSGPGEGR
jgi:hypothetical protein